MLKIVGTNKQSGRTIILLGLEEMNITRMREGKPVHIHGEELYLEKISGGFEIVIVLGKDTETLAKRFGSLIGPETVVTNRVKEKKN